MSTVSIPLDDETSSLLTDEEANTVSLGQDVDNETDYHELNGTIKDVQRLTDVKTALEELQLVADRIDNATEKDILLVDTALSAAMAGTDITPDEIAPGLEHYVGKRISTEGIGSFIKSIWEAILNGLKKIWSMLTKFFSGLFGRAKRTEAKAKKHTEQFTAKQNAKAKTSSIVLGSEAERLVFKGKVPGNEKDINDILDACEEILDAVPKYVLMVTGAADGLKTAISKFDETDPGVAMKEVADALGDLAKNNSGLKLEMVRGDSRYKDGTFAGYHMAGNKRLIALLPASRQDSAFNDPLTFMNAVAGTQYHLEEDVAGYRVPKNVSIRALDGSTGLKVAQRVEAIASKLQTFTQKFMNISTDSKEIKGVVKECDALDKRMGGKDLDPKAAMAYKAILNFSTIYTTLMAKLPGDTIRQVESTLEAVNTVLGKCYTNLE